MFPLEMKVLMPSDGRQVAHKLGAILWKKCVQFFLQKSANFFSFVKCCDPE